MKIAICDWSAETSKDIEAELKQNQYVSKVETYTDIDLFRNMLSMGQVYDVVFMEIDWKQKKTGIDFWEELQVHDPQTSVIYMSRYVQLYIEEIFEKTFYLGGILTKPIKTEYLQKSLERIRLKKENEAGKLMIRCNRRGILIPVHEIIYLESQLHKVNIVLENKEYQCNERLAVLENYLDERFVKIHKSYLVNMNYISEFSGSEMILRTGQRIPISKNRYADTKEKIIEYFKKE